MLRLPRAASLTLRPLRWYHCRMMCTWDCRGLWGWAWRALQAGAILLCSLAVSVAWAQRVTIPRNIVEERVLTFAAYHSPALSPNGQLLAYVNVTVALDGSKHQDLWLRNLRTGDCFQLSRNSECVHPTWSPQGDLIAVAAVQRQGTPASSGLWVMQADGSRQTQIVTAPGSEAPRSPTWSPVDSNRVAFLSTMELVAGSNPQHRMNIWTVDITNSSLLPCFVPAELEISKDSGLAWQTDGKAIFFLGVPSASAAPSGTQGGPGLWRVDLPGGKFEQVLPPPEDYVVTSLGSVPALGMLSALLLPRPGAVSKSATLVLLGAEPGSVHVIKSGLAPPEGESDVDYPQAVTWSQDGRTCVVVTGRDLLLLDLATRAEVETKGCVSNLRKLYYAFVAYTQAHEGRLPEAGVGSDGVPLWVPAITPYLSDLSLLHCPLDDSGQVSYDFNPALGGQVLVQVENRAYAPLLTERVPRHDGRRARLTADGQVRLG